LGLLIASLDDEIITKNPFQGVGVGAGWRPCFLGSCNEGCRATCLWNLMLVDSKRSVSLAWHWRVWASLRQSKLVLNIPS
jgi:hypothetical protein